MLLIFNLKIENYGIDEYFQKFKYFINSASTTHKREWFDIFVEIHN